MIASNRFVLLLLVSIGLGGCGPSDGGVQSGGTSTGAESTGSEASPDDTSGSTTTSRHTSSQTSGGTTSSETATATTGGPQACGNGEAEPGDFCLGELVTFPLPLAPWSVDVGDVDGDGSNEIVIGYNGPRVDVIGIDDEAPILETSTDLLLDVELVRVLDVVPRSGVEIVAVQSGGLSTQGRLDVISVTERGATVIDGVELGETSLGVAGGDLDGDGDLDLVASLRVSHSAGVVANDEAGLTLSDMHQVGHRPRRIAIADLDGDGALDVLVANENCYGAYLDPDGYCDPAELSVLYGSGSDGLASAEQHVLELYHAAEPAVGDLNGDGRPDVVVFGSDCEFAGPDPSCDWPGRQNVLWGMPDGGLSAPEALVLAPDTRAGRLVDLDADGALDVLLVHHVADAEAPGELLVARNLGDGSFDEPVAFGPTGDLVLDVAAGDLNGDGLPDLVTFDAQGAQLVIVFSDA